MLGQHLSSCTVPRPQTCQERFPGVWGAALSFACFLPSAEDGCVYGSGGALQQLHHMWWASLPHDRLTHCLVESEPQAATAGAVLEPFSTGEISVFGWFPHVLQQGQVHLQTLSRPHIHGHGQHGAHAHLPCLDGSLFSFSANGDFL